MPGEFADHFSVKAADYTRYRPHYPPELFDYLASICLQHARTQTPISYVCSIAEQLPFAGELFDRISVAQAVHCEVQRLLKPGGVLEVWGYGLFSITPDIDALIA